MSLVVIRKNTDEYNKRLLHYATAKRATAGQITNIVDGEFTTKWAGKLHGKFVKLGDEFKKDTKSQALDVARRYRQSCIDEALKSGLMIDQFKSKVV